MRWCVCALAIAGLLLPCAPARGAAEPCRDSLYTGDLAAFFVTPRELGSDWESVPETPSDPADDPELRAAGVRATRSLHYTRARRGGSEVCSLEIWGFASPAEARRARAEIAQPAWRVALRGNLLLMSRGVRLSRRDGFRPGLLPECHRLADLTEARADELLRCSGPP
jgi:hypothetical protein